MPANRVPSKILDARNSFRNHPERRNGEEPPVQGVLGEPPEWLPEVTQDVWREIQPLLPAGIAGESDRPMFMVLCHSYARFKAAAMTLERLPPQDMQQLVTTMARFGLSPADRTRVRVASGSDGENPFSQI